MPSDLAELETLAKQVPSMSGTPLLRQYASEAPDGTAIVEVGAWLGGGTVQLLLGLRDSGRKVDLHCFDMWTATPSEVEKAKAKAGKDISVGDDILPLFKHYMDPFGIDIQCHKGDVKDASWDGGPIAVYIDDAAKREPAFRHVLRTFGPSWIPGETTVFLMDYHLWNKHGQEDESLRFQKDFVESHPDSFETLVERVGKSTVAIFKYHGGVNFDKI